MEKFFFINSNEEIKLTKNKTDATFKKTKTTMSESEIKEINKCETKKSKLKFFLNKIEENVVSETIEKGEELAFHYEFCDIGLGALNSLLPVRDKFSGNPPKKYNNAKERKEYCKKNNLHHFHAGLYINTKNKKNCKYNCGYNLSKEDLVSDYVIHYSRKKNEVVIVGLSSHRVENNDFHIPGLIDFIETYKHLKKIKDK
jgi:hypothetical protein